MKGRVNCCLLITAFLSAGLLLFPDVNRNDILSSILRVTLAFAAQIVLFRVGKPLIIKILPLLLTGAYAILDSYATFACMWCCDPTVCELLTEYAAPFIVCALAWTVHLLPEHKKVYNQNFK